MTWVVGTSIVFGYAVGIADVQATISMQFGKDRYIDCVQKIHHVGNFVAAGFCRDIRNGFELIELLKSNLVSLESGLAWILDYVAREFGKNARECFELLPVDRQRPTQIMLFSVYPSQDISSGVAKSFVAKLASPDFKLNKVSRNSEVISMGSGNEVSEYAGIVDRLNEDWFPLAHMEIQNFGGFGGVVAISLQNEMIRHTNPGISSAIQVCYVKRGGVGFTFPEVNVDIGTSREREVKVPKLATKWSEFIELLKQQKISLSKASAFDAGKVKGRGS